MDNLSTNSDAFWNRVRLRQTVRDVALLFAVTGITLGLAAHVSLIRAQAVAAWPTAQGVVTSSGVESRPIAGRIPRSEPVVVITYRYEVDGQAYTSDTVTEGAPPVLAGTVEAERLLATYPVDTPVTVSYNPRDPTRAVLEQDAGNGTLPLLLTLFGISALFGLLALLLRPRTA